MYDQLTPEIIRQLKAVSDYVFLGDDINPDYAKDEMPIYGTHMPDMAVLPIWLILSMGHPDNMVCRKDSISS